LRQIAAALAQVYDRPAASVAGGVEPHRPIMLVGLAGVAAGFALQLRDLLVRPVVAEDEVSLMADVVMRVEDARELTRPSVAWVLPMVLPFGTAPAWWNAASIGFVILGLIALILIQMRTPPIATVARQAMSTP
jgi:hypothetical protein